MSVFAKVLLKSIGTPRNGYAESKIFGLRGP
jgi:hypothetical protein